MTATTSPDTTRSDQPLPVSTRGLTKRYGTTTAVEELDLDVPAGTVFGLIGPNGAGKTTTMRAIVTLLRPDTGTVAVYGHDSADDAAEVRRRVGFMPDFFGLYDGLTCVEYLEFFGAAYGLDTAVREQQVDDLLELVELDHRRDADVSELSRGMQQRLSLARALVHDPPLLVLDEPASGLDPRARVDLREILLQLSQMGHTIVVSSHILAELEELCDTVGIMEAGRMLAQGSPEQIRTAMRTARRVTVRVLGGDPALGAARAVAARHGATEVDRDGSRLQLELTGGEQAAADLLADLVDEGVEVVDFREDRGGLERLFLHVTEGIVQ